MAILPEEDEVRFLSFEYDFLGFEDMLKVTLKKCVPKIAAHVHVGGKGRGGKEPHKECADMGSNGPYRLCL